MVNDPFYPTKIVNNIVAPREFSLWTHDK